MLIHFGLRTSVRVATEHLYTDCQPKHLRIGSSMPMLRCVGLSWNRWLGQSKRKRPWDRHIDGIWDHQHAVRGTCIYVQGVFVRISVYTRLW